MSPVRRRFSRGPHNRVVTRFDVEAYRGLGVVVTEVLAGVNRRPVRCAVERHRLCGIAQADKVTVGGERYGGSFELLVCDLCASYLVNGCTEEFYRKYFHCDIAPPTH